jgi:hypothetical protein
MATNENKTHWKRLINPAFLGAYSLDPGKDKTVIIDHVVREMITSNGGKKEECSVCYLKGDKPLILNATNSKSVAALYGPYVEDWAGQQITLYAATTRLAGETVECLRIRKDVTPLKKEKQPISDERLSTALAKIKTGEYTSARLSNDFSLTKTQQSDVDKFISALVNDEIPGEDNANAEE